MNGLPAWLGEMVEAGLAPYRGVVTDEDLEWMRAAMIERLGDDPDLARLARDASPRVPTDESGKAAQKDVFAGLSEDVLAAVAARRS